MSIPTLILQLIYATFLNGLTDVRSLSDTGPLPLLECLPNGLNKWDASVN